MIRLVSSLNRHAILFATVAVCLVTRVCNCSGAVSPFQPPDAKSALSHSGQFMVRGISTSEANMTISTLTTNPALVRLEPALVTVSCERIKQFLAHELAATAPWKGRVYVSLFPAQATNLPITITTARFEDGWRYRVDLPELVERTRYVRAIVQSLLQEMANRRAVTDHTAEVPGWLISGLSQELLASHEIEIILPPPQARVNGLPIAAPMLDGRKENSPAQVRRGLHGRPPLSFEELSWPSQEPEGGDSGEVYEWSAQLFLSELCELPNGRACLRDMLALLPEHYNWQVAFLRAFQSQFERPLDAEKWWSLRVVHFANHDLGETWPKSESLGKLDRLLRASVEVRTSTNELPMHAELSLQTIIREWEPAKQTDVLRSKAMDLQWMRMRVSPELVTMVEDYRRTLDIYLDYLKLLQQVKASKGREHRPPDSRQSNEAIRKLDELDYLRATLRTPQTTAGTVSAK